MGEVGGRLIVSADDGGTCPGGAKGGSLFTVRRDATGVRKMLHSFCGAADGGIYPASSVTDVDGVIYGVVQTSEDAETSIYSLTPSGTETVVHTFTTDSSGEAIEGASPLLFSTESYTAATTCPTVLAFPSPWTSPATSSRWDDFR